MIIDALTQFSGSITGNTVTPQSIVGTGTITSTNVIDTATQGIGAIARDIGAGDALEIAIEVVQAVAGATSVAINLVEADDAAISTNVNTIVSTGAIPVASLTAGQLIPLHWDRAMPYQRRRYVALQYVITGTSTTGTVIAAVVKNFQDLGNNTLYPSGFQVF